MVRTIVLSRPAFFYLRVSRKSTCPCSCRSLAFRFRKEWQKSGAEARQGWHLYPWEPTRADTEVYLNGNTAGISRTLLPPLWDGFVVWHTHTRPSRTHTLGQGPSLSLRVSLQSAFLSLFIFIRLRSLFIIRGDGYANEAGTRGPRCSVYRKSYRAALKMEYRSSSRGSSCFFSFFFFFFPPKRNDRQQSLIPRRIGKRRVETYVQWNSWKRYFLCTPRRNIPPFPRTDTYTHACTYISAFRPRATAL